MKDTSLSALRIASLLALLLVSLFLVGLVVRPSGGRARRIRIIPRYISEKEIRGPTFHIHHNMRVDKDMENYWRPSLRTETMNAQRRRQKLVAKQRIGLEERMLQWTPEGHSGHDLDLLPVNIEDKPLSSQPPALSYQTKQSKFVLHPRIKQDFGSGLDGESTFSNWFWWLRGDSQPKTTQARPHEYSEHSETYRSLKITHNDDN